MHHSQNYIYQSHSSSWPHLVYGANVTVKYRSHGNAIFSRFAARYIDNLNISAGLRQQRGMLHAEVDLDLNTKLQLFCSHLNLDERGRIQQKKMIMEELSQKNLGDDPVIFCGDFNDWNQKTHSFFRDELGFEEAVENQAGVVGKSFPSKMPVLRLDRIYYRNLECLDAKVLTSKKDHRQLEVISDHLPILAHFRV